MILSSIFWKRCMFKLYWEKLKFIQNKEGVEYLHAIVHVL
jgi:hypothetical protein